MPLHHQSGLQARRGHPTRHTRDGDNLSPPRVAGCASETKSFVLIVEDPDAPSGTFRHWAMYNIPAGETGLPEGASAQGTPRGRGGCERVPEHPL